MPAYVETMAYRYAGREDVPWHGLGERIDRNEQVSELEFMQRAGANWPVLKRPIWYRPSTNSFAKQMEGRYVLMRGDNEFPLSIVGEQYKPVQNVQIFDFFRDFCNAGDMTLETAGVLDEGRRVWALATLKEGFTLANDDRVTGHLLFSNSHDGDALRIMFTPIRVVCANTLAMAHSAGHGFRLNHRTKFDPDVAKRYLGLASEQLHAFQLQAEQLSRTTMDQEGFKWFLDRLFPEREYTLPDNKGTEMRRPRAYEYASKALIEQTGAEKNQGTWWAGFNAITYMLDHNTNRISDGAQRLNSTWFGNGARIRQEALETALEMAK